MQGSVAEVKVDIVAADGRRLPTLMNAIRREIDGRLLHQIALIVVADRHKYERALLDARKRADAALLGEQQAKDELRRARSRLQLALGFSAAAGLGGASGRSGAAQLRTRRVSPARPVRAGRRRSRDVSPRRCRAPIANARQAPLRPRCKIRAGRYACTFRLHGVDGVERVVSSTGQGEFGPDGRMLRIVGVLQDVTEASLQRSAAEDRALLAEQMVGIVSHDLRNPLAVIAMSHAALERASPTEVQRPHARPHRALGGALAPPDFRSARLHRRAHRLPAFRFTCARSTCGN